jgi:hypothetical protein
MAQRALSGIIFSILTLILLIPIIHLARSANDTFTASATVGNDAPYITLPLSQTLTGATGTTAVVYVFFNATDANGRDDINESTAVVRINKSGETSRTSTSCVYTNISASMKQFNCSITLYYYDGSGSWTINATVSDLSNLNATNLSALASVTALDAIDVESASLAFSGSAGQSDIAASPEPLQINNTGNTNYVSLNITGINFHSGANMIGIGNVTMNVTDSNGPGQILVNGTEVNITGSTLNKGDNSMRDLYFWLDIPASQPAGSYNAQSAWTIKSTI